MNLGKSQWMIAFFLIVVMLGLMAFTQMMFNQQDYKHAMNLVQNVNTKHGKLGQSIDQWILPSSRECSLKTLSQFYGHYEVICFDLKTPKHVLIWKVNVIDGMVAPVNEEAVKLGQGEKPWPLE